MLSTRSRRVGTAAACALGLAPSIALPAVSAASATRSYTATATDRWGTVTVTIRVSGRTLRSVSASAVYHTPRSQQLDQFSLPTLQREALRARSANVQTVSGATVTSEAFIAALRQDRGRAHL